MITTEIGYKGALLTQKQLTKEQEQLAKDILKYENEFKIPSFTKIKDLKDFIQYESEEGTLVIFEGITYEVGDFNGLEREYGYESVSDAMTDADLDELVDGRVGILQKQ